MSENVVVYMYSYGDKKLVKAEDILNTISNMESGDTRNMPKIKKVIFHNMKVTEVIWEDGTKTKVETGKGDVFSPEYGLAMAIAKKYFGGYENFRKSLKRSRHNINGKISKVIED